MEFWIFMDNYEVTHEVQWERLKFDEKIRR